MAEERYTEFGLVYMLVDLTAKKDVTLTFNNAKYSSQSSLLDRDSFNDYITMEHNFSILDGTKSEFPVTPEPIGLFSSVKSASNSQFSNVPKIVIVGNDYHSTGALTLSFADNYPDVVQTNYYKDNGIIASKLYNVDNNIFVLDTPVSLWNKLEIQFLSTHIPDRYLKLTGLLFGKGIEWNETILQGATLVEEISRISDKISVDTLNFELIDLDGSLNFGNDRGIHNYFQRKQELLPYEIVNDSKLPLGKFYLDKYSYELSLGKMSSISFMGLMDGIAFNEGELYNGVHAKVVIDKIFEVCDFEDYEIDEETSNQLLYGAIAPTTARDALRQVLFACHSILDSTDSQQSIKICKTSGAQVYVINRDIKISTKVTKQSYISGVEIQYPEYTLQDEIGELAKDEFGPGQHTLVFNNPCLESSVSINRGTILKVRPYYVVFETSTAGEVILTGKQYSVKNNKLSANRSYIDPGEIENIVKYTTNLCNQMTAKELAKKLLYYHTTQLLTLDIKHIASDTSVNDLRAVQNETLGYNNYLGMFTNRTFDLTGGFIDTAKLTAYFNLQDYYYYTTTVGAGTELYSGGAILI